MLWTVKHIPLLKELEVPSISFQTLYTVQPWYKRVIGTGKEVSYILVCSFLYTLTQALIWDQRKSFLYQGFLYPGYTVYIYIYIYEVREREREAEREWKNRIKNVSLVTKFHRKHHSRRQYIFLSQNWLG